jgi:hypothetical protein
VTIRSISTYVALCVRELGDTFIGTDLGRVFLLPEVMTVKRISPPALALVLLVGPGIRDAAAGASVACTTTRIGLDQYPSVGFIDPNYQKE